MDSIDDTYYQAVVTRVMKTKKPTDILRKYSRSKRGQLAFMLAILTVLHRSVE
jgi:hypothetical protein